MINFAQKITNMNEQLQRFARQTLKDGLSHLPEQWRDTFRLMYGKKGMSIDDVVDKMPSEKLDWAMTQVENSKLKLAKPSPALLEFIESERRLA